MIRVDLKNFFFAKTLIQVDENTELLVNLVSGAKKIMKNLKWQLEKNKY